MTAIIYTLILTHITSIVLAIYLHRGMSHGTIKFSKGFDHFCRFWLWLTDGVNIRDWMATHRRHHRFTDIEGDPHSPYLEGIKTIAWTNFWQTCYYRYRNFYPPEDTKRYAFGAPDDWMEHNVYQPYQRVGLLIMLAINVMLFGWVGILIWLIQVAWTPFWSGTVITGFCHWKIGYKHPKSKDKSKNIPFLAPFLIGDEMHCNHHVKPYSANLKYQRWEFDLGWWYIKLFEKLKWLKVK